MISVTLVLCCSPRPGVGVRDCGFTRTVLRTTGSTKYYVSACVRRKVQLVYGKTGAFASVHYTRTSTHMQIGVSHKVSESSRSHAYVSSTTDVRTHLSYHSYVSPPHLRLILLLESIARVCVYGMQQRLGCQALLVVVVLTATRPVLVLKVLEYVVYRFLDSSTGVVLLYVACQGTKDHSAKGFSLWQTGAESFVSKPTDLYVCRNLPLTLPLTQIRR